MNDRKMGRKGDCAKVAAASTCTHYRSLEDKKKSSAFSWSTATSGEVGTMKTTVTSSFSSLMIPSPNPKTLFNKTMFIPVNREKISGISSISWVRFATIKCCSNSNSSENGESGNLKDALAGIVDKRVEELLNKEENRVLLDGLEKATLRVEMAKKELADIERQEMEAKLVRDYITKLESTTSEIAECQKDISEARAMIEEAERSLSNGDASTGTDTDATIKDKERIESIKAASIAALVGTLAGLPISLSRITSSSELILPLAITFASCALFGVTFRYVVRRDLDDFHLKSGACAAFGVVKGLATLGGGPPLELDASSFWSHALDGSVYVSENLLIFFFAALGLDICFKSRILSPYPIDRSVSETEKI